MYISRLLVSQRVLIVCVFIADLFLYSYKANLLNINKRVSSINKTTSFNLSFRYIDDVPSLNNPKFNDYINIIYLEELEIKDTTDAPKWAN